MNKKIILSLITASMAFATPQLAVAQQDESAPAIVVTAKLQKQWDKGSQLELKGLKERAKAEKALADANRDVIAAQSKRDNSRAIGNNAKDEFLKLTSPVPYFADADEAARWARQVDKVAGEWAKHDDRRLDGRADLEKAQKKQAKAQSALAKAQSDVDQGRSLKLDAEQRSQIGSITS
ncbi:hypothetical protein ACFOWX_12375 [Sphingorhabdus arenilitoris]|uniref:DUF4398 domain-containing protein n=1 Tax=Sphingorhabdus arenilitoris TaxID=1490041 RepID=A0ABV8RJX5_9SPHN